MKCFHTCLGILLFSIAQAQTTYSEDSIRLLQTLGWLEQKLTYNYYNIDDEEWWINRFTYNEASKTVTIKNIASPQLQAIKNKTYLQLNFKLEDLNPYTILIKNNEQNAGRLVAGKTIRVETFDHELSISKTRNSRVPSKISFLYISIPTHYEDSSSNYAQQVATRLKEAVYLSGRIYALEDVSKNYSLIKKVLTGNQFISNETLWTISNLYADILEIEVKDKELGIEEKRFLRFLPEGLELTVIKANSPTEVSVLRQENKHELEYTDGNRRFHFTTRNEFSYNEYGQTATFIRSK